jgi:hypothetical protein
MLSDTLPCDLPDRLRLAPGRVALWRSPSCLQLGLDQQRAMVLDDVPAPLATLLKRMDGIRSTAELVTEAQAAGGSSRDALLMLADLHRCGLVQEASAAGHGPQAGTASLWTPRRPAGRYTRPARPGTCCARGGKRPCR